VPSFNKSKGKSSPPKKCSILGVLEFKTRKNGGEALRKKVGAAGRGIYIPGLTEAGNLSTTALVNYILTEVVPCTNRLR